MLKIYLSAVVFVASVATTGVASESNFQSNFDPAQFQVGSIEIVTTPSANGLGLFQSADVPPGIGSEICNRPAGFDPFPDLGFGGGLVLDRIVNLGKAIWEIVKSGKASVDLRVDAATAIPAGLNCWDVLTHYQIPRSESKTLIIKNFANVTAIEFSYKVIWLPGGEYQGQGKYIGYATILPTHVYVMWGWSFSANASAATVFNVGSSQNPVGAINLNMNYKAESSFSTTVQAQSYYVDGEGGFREL